MNCAVGYANDQITGGNLGRKVIQIDGSIDRRVKMQMMRKLPASADNLPVMITELQRDHIQPVIADDRLPVGQRDAAALACSDVAAAP